MTTLHAGTAGFNAPRTRYARKLRFVEFTVREPAPSAKALAQWHKELGDDFTFAVVAPDTLWGERDFPLRDAKRTQTETDRLANVLGHLKPRVLVLRSPPDVRPGSAAYKRMREWLPRWAKMAPVVVWEPYGLWDREDAVEAVAGTGILVVADPLRDDVSSEKVVYARMKGLGADRRYHEGKLEDLGAALAHTDECFVVFDTQTGFVEARKLQVLADGGALVPDADASFEGDDLTIDTGELDEDEDEEDDESDDDDDDESDDDSEDGDDEDSEEGDEDFEEDESDDDESEEDESEEDEDDEEGDA